MEKSKNQYAFEISINNHFTNNTQEADFRIKE